LLADIDALLDLAPGQAPELASARGLPSLLAPALAAQLMTDAAVVLPTPGAAPLDLGALAAADALDEREDDAGVSNHLVDSVDVTVAQELAGSAGTPGAAAEPPPSELEPVEVIAEMAQSELRAQAERAPSVYGLLVRTGTRSLHAGLLRGAGARASTRTGAGAITPELPAGLDVLPGQRIHLTEQGAVLLDLAQPLDPQLSPAPAAELHAQMFSDALFPRAPLAEKLLAWVLPREGAPRSTRGFTPTTFAALACPELEVAP
jgi:hypothetical protein